VGRIRIRGELVAYLEGLGTTPFLGSLNFSSASLNDLRRWKDTSLLPLSV
jgi:hypothetical protein